MANISYAINKLNKNIFYSPLGYTLYLNFNSENNSYQVTNNNLLQGQTLNKVQSIYIDNSMSSLNTTITVQKTGQRIIVPGFGILSWSILLAQDDVITFSNASTTDILVTIILTDRNLPTIAYNTSTNNIIGNLSVSGTGTFTQQVIANGGLQTTSFVALDPAYFNSILNALAGINTTTIKTSSMATLQNLTVVSNASVGGNLNVKTINGTTPGTAVLPSSATFNNLTVSGTASFTGPANVHGLITAKAGVDTNTLDVTSNATIGGNLTVTTINGSTPGTSGLPSNASFTDLTVNESTNLHGLLTLDNAQIKGALQTYNNYYNLWFAGSNYLQNYNTATSTLATAIATGSSTNTFVKISPNGRYIWIGNQVNGYDNIQVYDTILKTLATIAVGNEPNAIAITKDGNTVWIGNKQSSTIQPINANTLVAGTAISLAGQPSALALTPDETALWFTESSNNSIQSYNLITGILGTAISLGSTTQPNALAISPDGSTLWISNYGNNTIQPYNLITGTLGTQISLSSAPEVLAITPDGNTLWIGAGETIIPLTIATLTLGSAISLAGYCYSIVIAPDNILMFLGLGNSTLVPFNLQTKSLGTAISLSFIPFGIDIVKNGEINASNIKAQNGNFVNAVSCKTLEVATVTATTATAGTVSSIMPAGYIEIMVNGAPKKLAYYNI